MNNQPSSRARKLRLKQLTDSLIAYEPLRQLHAPPLGWLKAIREALGRTQRQQASRVGITGPSLHNAEKLEATGRISISQLRRLAEGLDCELVYALVPRAPLLEQVERQADLVARRDVMGVAHSMGLEEQRPSNDFVARQVRQRREALLAGRWSALWR
jgi:predicted DNA-binding mobile mystery protein A